MPGTAAVGNRRAGWHSAPRRAALIIFCMAAGVRILLMLALHWAHPIENTELGKVTVELGLQHQFANPFAKPTGLTAHVAPAYPMLASVWVALFGDTVAAGIAAALMNIAFCSLSYALLPWIAAAAGLPVMVGTAAGLFPALAPINGITEIRFFEAPMLAFLTALITLVTIQLLRRDVLSPASALVYGVLCGIALLTSPVILTVFGGFFLIGLRVHARRLRSYAIFVALAALAAGVTLSPWLMRNYRVFQRFVFVRDNFGMELKMSNHDGVSPLLETNFDSAYFHNNHPYSNGAEADAVAAQTEVVYNDNCLRTAKAWIAEHPGEFLKLCLERAAIFWFLPGWPPAKALILYPLLLLAAWGAVRMIRDFPLAGWTLTAVAVLFPMSYYIIQVSSRYRLPMYWTVYFMASYAIFTTPWLTALRKDRRRGDAG